MTRPTGPTIAIACGGTGGHLFPGLAVAEQLTQRGCAVTLLISPKDVDQQGVKAALERGAPAPPDRMGNDRRAAPEAGAPMQVVTLPAVGLTRGRVIAFARGFVQSYRAAKKHFLTYPPQAALAMGGFTSAPPILAARNLRAQTFLHESNTIPGRANRWLSWVVSHAFVGFPQAATRLHTRSVTTTGTPVRPQFQPRDPAICRSALGLDPARPVLLVMGGSQGASGINELVMKAVPLLARAPGKWQLLHLTGPNDAEKVRHTCAALHMKAVAHSFFAEMELALGAATVAISRAGASSLAELAAMQVPSVLIPFPAATDDHQLHNARAFERTGAARLLEQKAATPETLAAQVFELESGAVREQMRAALSKWHARDAAQQIADAILAAIHKSADSLVCQPSSRGQSCPRSSDATERHDFSAA